MNVLFVDDNRETADLFVLCFNLKGHSADTAYDGLEALQIIEQNTKDYDILIVDHQMPGITGLEVVEQLRERADLFPIPIILFTGMPKGEIEPQAGKLGVARVIYKPFVPFDLIDLAQQVVNTA